MPMPRGHGERPDVVAPAGALRCDEVRERVVRLARRFALLLAQEVQPRQHARARLVGVNLDVVVIDAVRREQPDHAARAQPTLADDLLEHAARVRVQVAGLLADHGVGEDVRKLAGEFPGVEERHPVDVARQILERVVLEDAHSEEARHGRRVRIPTAIEAIGARLRDRQLRALGLLAVVLLASRSVIALDLRDVVAALRRPRAAGRCRPTATHPSRTRPAPCTADRSSPQYAPARWSRRRSAAAARSPAAASPSRRAPSRRATA